VPSTPEPPRDAPIAWSPRCRAIVSVLVAFHLSAVVVAPWHQPGPPSQLSKDVAMVYQPYLDGMFINHGYRFFDGVGRGHLVKYEIDLQDGTTIKGVFPDRDRHVPRLYYHRLLMMSDQMVYMPVPLDADGRLLVDPPAGFRFDSAADRLGYLADRSAYYQALGHAQPILESIAGYFIQQHDAIEVRLAIQERTLPTREQTLDGIEMADERFIQTRPLGRIKADGTWQWTEQILGTGKPIFPRVVQDDA